MGAKKITIKIAKSNPCTIIYPEEDTSAVKHNAATTKVYDRTSVLYQLNHMRKIFVPCDIMTGKTEKLADIEKYKAVLE